MAKRRSIAITLYFLTWAILAFIAVVLNILNYEWHRSNIVQGIFFVFFLSVIESNVLELVVVALAAMVVKSYKPRRPKEAPYDNLTVVLNYNLLALMEQDAEEAVENMYRAYMGNLSPNVAAVLVSATREQNLKDYEIKLRDDYRALIRKVLYEEGKLLAQRKFNDIPKIHMKHVWQMYSEVEPSVFMSDYLPEILSYYTSNFMVIQRVSRVLKKCGQYQDLMLLSEGDNAAFTYTDKDFYGEAARPYGSPLFYDSQDVTNVKGRQFDYTFVLDADTRVESGDLFHLLAVAAAYPSRGIIQPGIKLRVQENDTMFMHLEKMRQDVNEPFTRVMTEIMKQAGYYGKALLKNRVYIDQVLGTRDCLLEKVPIDVLSHDTFEAAILKPVYAPSVYLYENPCYNYITWNIRESRWNRGEVLLSMYFWPWLGNIFYLLQRAFQGEKATKKKIRTKTKLDFVTAYIAYSALRQMSMKPLLLAFVLVHVNIHCRYYWIPFTIVMFLVIVFPKFAVITCTNWKAVLLETFASIIQFTPEPVIGTFRFFRAIEANISSCCCRWVPQRVVEDELRKTNPFLSSLKYFWGYALIAAVCIFLVVPFYIHLYMFILFVGVFILPFYCGLTSYNKKFQTASSDGRSKQKERKSDQASGDIKARKQTTVRSRRSKKSGNQFDAQAGSTADPFRSLRIMSDQNDWDRLVNAV